MTDSQLPLTGDPEVEAGHAADEASGVGAEVCRGLESLGFAQPLLVHSGRYARVYAARARNGEKVAVQVQAPYALQRAKARHSIRNYLRSKLLTLLTPVHPNLVRYLSSGVLCLKGSGTRVQLRLYYVAMAFVEGKTLQEALGDPAFRAGGLERLHKTIVGILEGWSAIHRRGLRQGDISPANIILEDGTLNPVLVDLRFSLRFGRRLIHEHRRFRSTLRALLTGHYQSLRLFKPLDAEAVIAYWQKAAGTDSRGAAGTDSQSLSARELASVPAELRAWLDFETSLGENGRLYLASPPQLLAAARELALPPNRRGQTANLRTA